MKKQMFILEIDDTQDHSWQGQLKWIQGNNMQSFRSVVEMLRLIDSAVNEDENTTAGESPGTSGGLPVPWEDAGPGDSPGPDV